MAINLRVRRKAARLIAAGKTRSAANVYRAALKRGEHFRDAETELLLLKLLAP